MIPGKPAESRLLRSVSRTQEPHMPPGTKQQLSAEEVRAVRDWIALGVPWPEVARPERHWSFEPLRVVTLLGLTKSLALEVAKDGITVNAICPGPVHTLMNDSSMVTGQAWNICGGLVMAC